MLIDAGADLNIQDTDGWTALMMAERYSNCYSTEQTVKMLIDAGAELNMQDKKGWTALMMAVCYSNYDSSEQTVKMLIDAGADVNIQDKDGWTALMEAAVSSTTKVFEKLLSLASKQLVPILRKISGLRKVDRFVLRMIALEWKFSSSDPQVIREKLTLKMH